MYAFPSAFVVGTETLIQIFRPFTKSASKIIIFHKKVNPAIS